MKLTLEQRTWIERQMWPAAEDAARAFTASISGEGVAINSADFAPISVALAVDRSDNAFVVVSFSEGNDIVADAWLAKFLMDRFPGIEIECRTEW